MYGLLLKDIQSQMKSPTNTMSSSLLVVFTFLIVCGSTTSSSILNIGILSSWSPVTRAAWGTISSTQVNLFNIDIGKRMTAYEKMIQTHRQLRQATNQPTHAVIGPYDPWVSLAMREFKIFYLCVTPMEDIALPYQVQLIPEMKEISDVFLDVSTAYEWSTVSVFYDDDKGFSVLKQLMADHNRTVRAWNLPEMVSRKHIRDCLIAMRKALVERCIVLCDKRKTDMVLDEARNLAMLSTPPYSWMFYDPGDETKNILNKYRDILVNFTVVTLLPFNHSDMDARNYPRLDFALAADALGLVVSVADEVRANPLFSSSNQTDELFQHLFNLAIRSASFKGHSGLIEFDERGMRRNYTLSLTALTGNMNYLRGHWYSKDQKIKLYKVRQQSNQTKRFPLKGRKVKVVMIEEQPFTMRKRDYMLKRGNTRFEGFAVDLIDAVAQHLGFEYEIYLVNDGKFGSLMENGEWNGLIGELLAGNATMSVAPLAINAEREEVVDFTKPFKTRYISVVMRIPVPDTSYFEFLNPLSLPVWLCTVCTFIVVSVILYALERIGRKNNPDQESPEISIRESFWFVFGSLLQGNTDSTPCTIPGRILTSAWWFFALILISSYTANLAAFLTVKKINTPIKSVTDLSQQTKIKYGTVKDSGVMAFFRNTNIEHFAKMWLQMSELSTDAMVDNTTQGYEMVKKGDYAFFWDTNVNKYRARVDCDIMEIGPMFDPKGFGIGVPPGATYKDDLSLTILKLGDRGKLHELETKWWDTKGCPDMTPPTGDVASQLQFDNVAGVFFILVGGIIIAAIACLGEYFTNAMIKASKMAVSKIGADKGKQKNYQRRGDQRERNSFL